jgi:hypothetical protein
VKLIFVLFIPQSSLLVAIRLVSNRQPATNRRVISAELLQSAHNSRDCLFVEREINAGTQPRLVQNLINKRPHAR